MRKIFGVIVIAGLLAVGIDAPQLGAQETVSGLLAVGARLFQQGRYDEALGKFLRAVKLEPANADAHAWLGRTHLQKALLEFKAVARLSPTSENGRTARKWIERIQGTAVPANQPGATPPRTAAPRITSLGDLEPALGNPYFRQVTLFGQTYERGFKQSACRREGIVYNLGGKYTRFEALVGVEDNSSPRVAVVVKVVGDGQPLFESPAMRTAEVPIRVNVSVRGVVRFELIAVLATESYCEDVVWANPKLMRE